jgi:hypothetical protein
MSGSDLYAEIRGLVPDHVCELRTRPERRFKILQVSRHAAKIEFGNGSIQTLKPARLVKFQPSVLDFLSQPIDFGVSAYPSVIIIALVNIACV